MTGNYRKRFVILTMALISVVLLTAFTVQGVLMCRNDYRELQTTMELMLKPWNEPNDDFRKLDGERENGKRQEPREPDGKRVFTPDGLDVITVFRDGESGEVSVLSQSGEIDGETIYEAVSLISSREESFGTLPGFDLIYCRENKGKDVKIAIVPGSYMTGRVLKNTGLLLLVFVLSTGLFLIISIYLSKVAARPMEKAVDMERQFVADISHDLKTPITVVLANNSILKSNPELTVREQSQWIDSTDEAAKNMMGMVNEMLTLSSLENAGRKTELYDTDLSACVEKSALQLESVAYERGITLEENVEAGVHATTSLEFAERICTGLLDNALKYEPEGGTVTVCLRTEKRKAVLEVVNSGSRIPDDDLPHIFERFYRGDKSRGQSKGHGLGLPIIKRMTELSGASITAKSGENGTVFSVSFELSGKI